MITAAMIKEKAKELGAGVCGIGDIKHFIGDDPQRNPLSILPNATCIIGFGIPVPKGLYMAMDEQRQYFNYTNLAVKYTDEMKSIPPARSNRRKRRHRSLAGFVREISIAQMRL